MKFPVLWSGLVSRVGASHRVNLMHLFPLDRNAQKNYYDYETTMVFSKCFVKEILVYSGISASIDCQSFYVLHKVSFSIVSLNKQFPFKTSEFIMTVDVFA